MKSWHQQVKRKPKESRTHNGVAFDSVGEMRRYQQLELLQRGKMISDLKRQVRFPLTCGGKPVKYESGRAAYYIADFTYMREGELIVEDFKGYDGDDSSKLRRAVFTAETGINVLLTGPASVKKKKAKNG